MLIINNSIQRLFRKHVLYKSEKTAYVPVFRKQGISYCIETVKLRKIEGKKNHLNQRLTSPFVEDKD